MFPLKVRPAAIFPHAPYVMRIDRIENGIIYGAMDQNSNGRTWVDMQWNLEGHHIAHRDNAADNWSTYSTDWDKTQWAIHPDDVPQLPTATCPPYIVNITGLAENGNLLGTIEYVGKWAPYSGEWDAETGKCLWLTAPGQTIKITTCLGSYNIKINKERTTMTLEIGQTYPYVNKPEQKITIVAHITHPTHPFLGVITQKDGSFLKAIPFNARGLGYDSAYSFKPPVKGRVEALTSGERAALRGIVNDLSFDQAKPYLSVKFVGQEREVYDFLRAN